MKIAFIGTHGVGKTTLCFDLAAALKRHGIHVDIVKEVARLSPLPINRQTSLDAQLWILMTQIAEEIRSASQHDVVVCDRSVLDNYAYMVRAFGPQTEVSRLVDYWLRTYDLLFKVPVTGRALADGVRDIDEPFVLGIDHLVDQLISARHLTVCERLDPLARDQWASTVTERVLTAWKLHISEGTAVRG